MLYYSKDLKENFYSFLKLHLKQLQTQLKLNIITIEPNLASQKYVSIKQNLAQKLGIGTQIWEFDHLSDNKKIQELLTTIQKEKEGLIFQLPVPEKFAKLVPQTPMICDVDLLGYGFNQLTSLGLLPPTIGAIDLVIKSILEKSTDIQHLLNHQINLKSKVVCVVGQGKLVGSPLLEYLKNAEATIISLNKDTPNLQQMVRLADIVISAAGQQNLLKTDSFKPHTIVIDASTSESNGSLVGDVDVNIDHQNISLSPSPGGIGRLTVLYLFWNLYSLSKIYGK